MNAYADTGLLVSLYGQDANSADARSLADRHRPTFILTDFGEAEFANACQLCVFRKQWTPPEARIVREKFSSHLRYGIFQIEDVPSQVWTLTSSLSEQYTAALGTRTLDVLHVATALLLKPDAFCSFDERQRKLAGVKGLRVLPA
jgi:predicted nucleic acid-binding protein